MRFFNVNCVLRKLFFSYDVGGIPTGQDQSVSVRFQKH